MTPADEPFLLRVYASTRAAELAAVPWSEAEKDKFVAMQFEAQRADYERRFPDANHSVILSGGVPVGRIWIDRASSEIRLLDVALLTDHRNQGIGTDLVRELIDEARAAALPLRHSVYKSNRDALRLYERLGFHVVEDFDAYVLMEWGQSG